MGISEKVDGWGKIQLVDRLSRPELSEPIKDWLIYEGYKTALCMNTWYTLVQLMENFIRN